MQDLVLGCVQYSINRCFWGRGVEQPKTLKRSGTECREGGIRPRGTSPSVGLGYNPRNVSLSSLQIYGF